MPDRRAIETGYRAFQQQFVDALVAVDPEVRFHSDRWDRPGGGGGLSMVAGGDTAIEKAAVNFSSVSGETPDRLSERLAIESDRFYATGVSIIVHPSNPFAPTFHANIRYFETDSGLAWFGGGADLTPHYLFVEDAEAFHTALAESCLRHPVADYPAWKVTCDEYFHLPHRGEARGLGGIFFDHLRDDLDDVWRFQLDLADTISDVYPAILERRKNTAFGPSHRQWQLYRRGRYVEFNLVWDRGTKFGLETSGRTESILASLPPLVRFEYGHEPEPGSPEAELTELLRGEPRTWVPDSLLSSGATTLGRSHE